jgi:hypothetical protein
LDNQVSFTHQFTVAGGSGIYEFSLNEYGPDYSYVGNDPSMTGGVDPPGGFWGNHFGDGRPFDLSITKTGLLTVTLHDDQMTDAADWFPTISIRCQDRQTYAETGNSFIIGFMSQEGPDQGLPAPQPVLGSPYKPTSRPNATIYNIGGLGTQRSLFGWGDESDPDENIHRILSGYNPLLAPQVYDRDAWLRTPPQKSLRHQGVSNSEVVEQFNLSGDNWWLSRFVASTLHLTEESPPGGWYSNNTFNSSNQSGIQILFHVEQRVRTIDVLAWATDQAFGSGAPLDFQFTTLLAMADWASSGAIEVLALVNGVWTTVHSWTSGGDTATNTKIITLQKGAALALYRLACDIRCDGIRIAHTSYAQANRPILLFHHDVRVQDQWPPFGATVDIPGTMEQCDFTWDVSTTGMEGATWTATGLPSGVGIDTNGQITPGTPATGTYDIEWTATAPGGGTIDVQKQVSISQTDFSKCQLFFEYDPDFFAYPDGRRDPATGYDIVQPNTSPLTVKVASAGAADHTIWIDFGDGAGMLAYSSVAGQVIANKVFNSQPAPGSALKVAWPDYGWGDTSTGAPYSVAISIPGLVILKRLIWPTNSPIDLSGVLNAGGAQANITAVKCRIYAPYSTSINLDNGQVVLGDGWSSLCSSLHPDMLLNVPNLATVNSLFKGFSSRGLVLGRSAAGHGYIPFGLFRGNHDVTDIRSVFEEARVSAIPDDLFVWQPSALSADYVFKRGARTTQETQAGIKFKLPDNLFCPGITSAKGAFSGQLCSIAGKALNNKLALADISAAFSDCKCLNDVNGAFTGSPNVQNASSLFAGCSLLSNVPENLLYPFEKNVKDLSYAFKDTNLDIAYAFTDQVVGGSYIKRFQKLETLQGAFMGSKIRATEMAYSVFSMFNTKQSYGYPALKSMESMFEGCGRLTVSWLSPSYMPALVNVSRLFCNCQNLDAVVDTLLNSSEHYPALINPSRPHSAMAMMFYNCVRLRGSTLNQIINGQMHPTALPSWWLLAGPYWQGQGTNMCFYNCPRYLYLSGVPAEWK